MKFYSEITKQLYDDEKTLAKAEQEIADKKAAKEKARKEAEVKKASLKADREKRAKEVEDAFKVANTAQDNANKLLNAFVKDYGSFHMTMKKDTPSLFDSYSNLFDFMLNGF